MQAGGKLNLSHDGIPQGIGWYPEKKWQVLSLQFIPVSADVLFSPNPCGSLESYSSLALCLS